MTVVESSAVEVDVGVDLGVELGVTLPDDRVMVLMNEDVRVETVVYVLVKVLLPLV